MRITIKKENGENLGSFDAEPWKVLLSQIESQGIEIPSACHAGMCAACMCHVEKGGEYLVKDFRTQPAFPLADDEVMTCIGALREGEGEVILRTLY